MSATGARRISPIALPSWPARDGSLAFLIVQAAPLLAMTLLVVTRYWQDHPALGWGLIGLTAAVWLPELRLRRARLWWFAYVAGIFLYTLLRALADETAIGTKTDYVIDIEGFLFFGAVPSEWLQERLFSARDVSLLDFLAVATHWSFFIAPHAAAVAIFLWKRELFGRYAVIVVGTMYVGLLLFFLVPTTPPWLAGELGKLEVVRVMDFVGAEVNGETYNSLYKSLGEPNSVAAMPSIHMGVTFAMYLWARGLYPRLAKAFLAYSILMGAALVYMAEHYVADLLVGVVIAVGVYLVAGYLAGRLQAGRTGERTHSQSAPSV